MKHLTDLLASWEARAKTISDDVENDRIVGTIVSVSEAATDTGCEIERCYSELHEALPKIKWALNVHVHREQESVFIVMLGSHAVTSFNNSTDANRLAERIASAIESAIN